MKKQKCCTSNFSCQVCGNVIPLPRKISRQRALGHKKHLWCVKCKRLTPHTELHECSSIKEFERFHPEKEIKQPDLIDFRTQYFSLFGQIDENYVAFMFFDRFVEVESFFEAPDKSEIAMMGAGPVGVFDKQGKLINSMVVSAKENREATAIGF